MKGKTIVDIKLDCGELWLKFKDNTFAVFVVNNIRKLVLKKKLNTKKDKKISIKYNPKWKK